MREKNNFLLLEKGKRITLICREEENSAVKCAVLNLAEDIKRVCGCEVELAGGEAGKGEAGEGEAGEVQIRIATMDTSWFEGVMPEEIRPFLDRLRDGKGRKRWEAYLHQVSGNSLCIVGTDRRGTVFGIYELSEQLGVSPWYFWADVPVRKKERFLLPCDYSKADWPDVPYRGIFLNDEEELEAWAKRHTKDDTIGPETYRRVFELLLRLKANYIWPAMHVNYFNENPENGRLAQEMGIVVGTSHCDMLLRSNQNEWNPWLEKKGLQGIRYDYSLPGENRRAIREYWSESVDMNRDYEVSYTIGMRGIHDSGFVTETIDKDIFLSTEEKRKRKIDLLEQVFADQKQILKDVLGDNRAKHALQTFIPYKEVLDLYHQGLNVPEDVTLVWVDDNFGYMRRYPDERERKRAGGNGLYYHASYWAFPGMSYLFFNSIPLAQTGNELKKCWESGIQKMWVLNVGALKPLEIDMDFFLRYGWEAGREDAETKDVFQFTAGFMDRNFSGGFGEEMADIYNRFTQLNNMCKPEHLHTDQFSQTVCGNEAKRRMEELRRLADRAGEIYCSLPLEERDGFYELFLMKLQASYYINASFYYADRSRLLWKHEGMQAADSYLELSRRMDHRKQELLYYYNHVMQNGKWEGILTPESFSPPPTALYPSARPALKIGEASLGLLDTEPLIFYSYGMQKKRISLFNKGCGGSRFTVEAPEWVQIVPKEGLAEAETEIQVSVKKDCFVYEKGRSGRITIKGEKGECFTIEVRAEQERAFSKEGVCFHMEMDGCLSIPADRYDLCVNTDRACWRRIEYLGRGNGSAMEAFVGREAEMERGENEEGRNGWMWDGCRLEYPFYLETEGAHTLEIHRFLTLNPGGRIRLAVGVDGRTPVCVESNTVDEWKGNWKDAVMNDGEKLYLALPWLSEGLHRLMVYPMDRYVTLNRFVIYTKGIQKSNLGPTESPFFDGMVWRSVQEENDRENMGVQEEFWEELYGKPKEEELLLPMLYASPSFWKTERLYARSDERENRLGRRKYLSQPDGTKDVFAQFGEGIFMEQAGRIFIEAEYALENSENAYLTASLPDGKYVWQHTQAETDGRTGFAMVLEGRGLKWKEKTAPGMHYRINVSESGGYLVWLLMRFEDDDSDACRLAFDGRILDVGEMVSARGSFFTYSMKQRWHWRAVALAELDTGEHLFSIYGSKSGLQIDRIYISRGEEWPPVDAGWKESLRRKI